MLFWILIFNQQKMPQLDHQGLKAALTEANIQTLCAQYGLDAEGIAPALRHLELIYSKNESALYFMLRYAPIGERPLVIYRWGTDDGLGRTYLQDYLVQTSSQRVIDPLSTAREIIGIELSRSQLTDLGLLLGYEIARWCADAGEGIVLGLDGIWYRLNPHQAFVPVTSSGS